MPHASSVNFADVGEFVVGKRNVGKCQHGNDGVVRSRIAAQPGEPSRRTINPLQQNVEFAHVFFEEKSGDVRRQT